MPENNTGTDIVDDWMRTRANIISDAGSRPHLADFRRLADFHNGASRKMIRYLGIDSPERMEALQEIIINARSLFGERQS